MIADPALSVDGVLQTQRNRVLLVAVLSVAGAIAGGLMAAILAESGQSAVVAVFAGAILPIVFWRLPSAAIPLFVFFGAAIARYGDPTSTIDFLARVPMWRSLNDAAHISGLYVMPFELVLAIALLVWVAKDGAARKLEWPRTELWVSLLILLGTAMLAEVHGVIAHGDFKISLYELRPFVYLAGGYLLASQSLRSRNAVMAVLWAFVLGTAYRGMIGTDLALKVANVFPRPNELLEHDESFFFGLYLILTVALWTFGMKGWLRRVATALAPFVLYADLANNRRAAWVILPAGLVVVAVVTWLRNPARRKMITGILAVMLLVGTGYVFAFRYSTSSFGFPAHAIWSNWQPDPRDASSNLYRELENASLAENIRSNPIVGTGFGLPFNHGQLSFDASSFDPLVFYIPHNSILWVWVKMGILGMFAFWWTMAVAVVGAARVARHGNRDAALLAVVAISSVMGFMILGWVDVGLSAVRVCVTVGCVLGAFEAAARLSQLSSSMVLDSPGAATVIRPSTARRRTRAGLPVPSPAAAVPAEPAGRV